MTSSCSNGACKTTTLVKLYGFYQSFEPSIHDGSCRASNVDSSVGSWNNLYMQIGNIHVTMLSMDWQAPHFTIRDFLPSLGGTKPSIELTPRGFCFFGISLGFCSLVVC